MGCNRRFSSTIYATYGKLIDPSWRTMINDVNESFNAGFEVSARHFILFFFLFSFREIIFNNAFRLVARDRRAGDTLRAKIDSGIVLIGGRERWVHDRSTMINRVCSGQFPYDESWRNDCSRGNSQPRRERFKTFHWSAASYHRRSCNFLTFVLVWISRLSFFCRRWAGI